MKIGSSNEDLTNIRKKFLKNQAPVFHLLSHLLVCALLAQLTICIAVILTLCAINIYAFTYFAYCVGLDSITVYVN